MKKKTTLLTLVMATLLIPAMLLCSCAQRVFITFDADGGFFGENETQVLILERGERVREPEEPKREGFSFAGWDKTVETAGEDTVIRAVWEELGTYTVTFELDGGSADESLLIQKLTQGEMPEDFVPTLEGKTFLGWDKELLPVTADTVYTAVWEGEKFTVTFELCGGKTDGETVYRVEAGESVTPPEVTRAGFTLSGWSEKTDNVTSEMKVQALWADTGKLQSEDGLFEKCAPSAVKIICLNGETELQGSGFIISSDGLIATCLHVVAGCDRISVVLYDNRVFEVKSIASYDAQNDVALLRIDASSLPALNTGSAKKGDAVYSIAAPGNEKWSLTKGKITDAGVDAGSGKSYVSTLPIRSGSSGSALLSDNGTVVGINSAAAVDSSAAYSLDIALLDMRDDSIPIAEFAAQTQRYVTFVPETEPNGNESNKTMLYKGQYVNASLTSDDIDCYGCHDTIPVWYIYFPKEYKDYVAVDFSGGNDEIYYGEFNDGAQDYCMYTVTGDGVLTVKANQGLNPELKYTVAALEE